MGPKASFLGDFVSEDFTGVVMFGDIVIADDDAVKEEDGNFQS